MARPLKPPHISHTEATQRVNAIEFTPREMDILACLLGGRSYKKTADLLDIAHKTVGTHIYHIMEKLGCHAREDVIELLKQSPLLPQLNKHYLSLLKESDFTHKLKVIALSVPKSNPPTCLLIDEQENVESSILTKIQHDLTLAGLHVQRGNLKEEPGADHLICPVHAQMLYNTFGSRLSITHSPITQCLDLAKHKRNTVIFVIQGPIQDTLPLLPRIHYIPLEEGYLLSVLEMLKYILPTVPIAYIIKEFLEQWSSTVDTTENAATPSTFIHSKEKENQQHTSKTFNPYKQAVGVAIILGIIVVCSLSVLGFKTTRLSTIFRFPLTIRSDLLVPMEEHSLERPQLLAKIHERLAGEKGIKTVVLVGIGGAGKTTLARQYARHQKRTIVWELNAETPLTLLTSFEQLAYALSKTSEERQELERIKKLDSPKEYTPKLLHFVKHKLKNQSGWFLIFDNMENFSAIQTFFPADHHVWGNGKVLITTRNNTIKVNKYIKPTHVIVLHELSSSEKRNLFLKIMGRKLRPDQKLHIENFLRSLPSFPLDVAVAAYYIKNKHISYEAYLERIQTINPLFDRTQSELLQEIGDYFKTRYGIITSSLEELISTCDDFKELLLLISMLEAQNIPQHILEINHKRDLTDQFINQMRKYSLLNCKTHDNHQDYLSIHHSTQQITLIFLNHLLDVVQKEHHVNNIVCSIEQYCQELINHIDLEKMRHWCGHLHMCLTHTTLLSEKNKGRIEVQLGRLYFYLGNFQKAQTYLEQGLSHLSYPDTQKSKTLVIAQALSYLGVVKHQFGHYKAGQDLLETSLRLYQEYFPSDYTGIAWSLLQVGRVYVYLGEYKQAQRVFLQSIALYTKHYGEQYHMVAWALGYLGEMYDKLGQQEKAIHYLKKSLRICNKVHGKQHNRTLWVLFQLGKTYKNAGQYIKAQDLLEKSYTIYKKYYPESQSTIAWNLTYLGDVYRLLGFYQKSSAALLESDKLLTHYYGKVHIYTEWNAAYVGQLYTDMGQHTRAQKILEKSLEMHRQKFKPHHIKIGWAAYALANAYLQGDNLYKAEKRFQEAENIYVTHYGKQHAEYAFVLRDFGYLYARKGNHNKAEQMLHNALDILKQHHHVELYKCYEHLGDLYHVKSLAVKDSNQEEYNKHKAQSVHAFNEAIRIVKDHFPPTSAHRTRLKAKLKNTSCL